jgi:hypothetical protein
MLISALAKHIPAYTSSNMSYLSHLVTICSNHVTFIQSPKELLGSFSHLQHTHFWGCPVYALDPRLQDGKKIPKMDCKNLPWTKPWGISRTQHKCRSYLASFYRQCQSSLAYRLQRSVFNRIFFLSRPIFRHKSL